MSKPIKIKFYTKDNKKVFFKARKTRSSETPPVKKVKAKTIKAWAVKSTKKNYPLNFRLQYAVFTSKEFAEEFIYWQTPSGASAKIIPVSITPLSSK